MSSSFSGYKALLSALGKCRKVFGNDLDVYDVESLANYGSRGVQRSLRPLCYNEYLVLLYLSILISRLIISMVGFVYGLVPYASSCPARLSPPRSRLRHSIRTPCSLHSTTDSKFYYTAMILDPIMRSSWLFYVVFPGQKQHSAATSFFIGLGEVFRRFMWNFFRVENEHMTNVGHFMATRDVPLPFNLRPETGVLEAQPPPAQPKTLKMQAMGTMKRAMVRMTNSLRVKHAEDFARRPGQEKGPQKGKMPDETDFSSDLEQLEEQHEDSSRGQRMLNMSRDLHD